MFKYSKNLPVLSRDYHCSKQVMTCTNAILLLILSLVKNLRVLELQNLRGLLVCKYSRQFLETSSFEINISHGYKPQTVRDSLDLKGVIDRVTQSAQMKIPWHRKVFVRNKKPESTILIYLV